MNEFDERKEAITNYVKEFRENKLKQEAEKEQFLKDINKRLKEIRFIKEI